MDKTLSSIYRRFRDSVFNLSYRPEQTAGPSIPDSEIWLFDGYDEITESIYNTITQKITNNTYTSISELIDDFQVLRNKLSECHHFGNSKLKILDTAVERELSLLILKQPCTDTSSAVLNNVDEVILFTVLDTAQYSIFEPIRCLTKVELSPYLTDTTLT